LRQTGPEGKGRSATLPTSGTERSSAARAENIEKQIRSLEKQ